MKELTKYLKFFFVSNIILLLGCVSPLNNEETIAFDKKTTPLTREDSILFLADELKINVDQNKDNINTILDKIILEKKNLIKKMDSLSQKANQIELMAYELKKKEDDNIKKNLIEEISIIKNELEIIKQLAREKDILNKDNLTIPQKEVNVKTKTFEDLEPGNYITRLDKYYLIRVFVSKNREVVVSDPILDSITILKSSGNVSPRMAKELQQIRDNIKNKD